MTTYEIIMYAAATVAGVTGIWALVDGFRTRARVLKQLKEREEEQALDNSKIVVTNQNVLELQSTLDALVDKIDFIVNMTLDYPVIIVFAGYRRVFENREEVEALINELRTKLAEFNPAF